MPSLGENNARFRPRTVVWKRSTAKRLLGRRGGWFEHLSCPHYTSELLVYFGLALLLQRPAGALPLLCSALNLGFTARQTHAWYRRKFEDYPAERWAMIPWVC